MPSVQELSAPYGNFMLSPIPGTGVCRTCLTFTEGHAQCYPCSTTQPWLDAVLPISYSVAHGQLHHALASYKRLSGEVARRLSLELAAVLWRFLDLHEPCAARMAGLEAFDLVVTVPSGTRDRESAHPLAGIVGELCGVTRERHRPLLELSRCPASEHDFDSERFTATAGLAGDSVLLIDDTWTTGASAQSAAAALKRAGAGKVAVVVIGRHLKRDWRDNDRRLRQLPRPFDWSACAACRGEASIASTPQWRRR